LRIFFESLFLHFDTHGPHKDRRRAGLPLTPGFAEGLGLEAADLGERLIVGSVATAEKRAQPETERTADGTRTELRIAARVSAAEEEWRQRLEREADGRE
jgi:hypothetical protein